MAWLKIDDKARGNPKLRAVGKPVRGAMLMVWSFCAEQSTDGWVPEWVVKQEFNAAELEIATTTVANGTAPLLHKPGDDCECLTAAKWTVEMGGLWCHDWLVNNPSKSENRVHRAKGRELKDVDLRYLIHRRDGNACRYCGVVVPWADKKSPRALTIDHVNPTLAAGADNLVVACTACNSSKKDAMTPEAAGLSLLPPPIEVPETWWPKGTDPESIKRAWRDEPPQSIAPDHRSIDDESPDLITDRSPIESRSDTRSIGDPHPSIKPARKTTDQAIPTATASADATGDALPPGSGRDGSGGDLPPVPTAGDVGPAGRRPIIGPATTPRSASSPPTYRKSATSNPPDGPP